MSSETSTWLATTTAHYIDSHALSTEPPAQALLVTDLKDFTSLLDRTDDRYARIVIQAHNQILRQCLHAHRGVEHAYTGDGVIAAFDRIESALRCAIAMQRGFQLHNTRGLLAPLHVRVGLHLGRPLVLDDNLLFGKCVNTAVRLCATARPGGVVASEQIVSTQTASGLRFRPLGARALKGLADPLHIYELEWDAVS